MGIQEIISLFLAILGNLGLLAVVQAAVILLVAIAVINFFTRR